MSNADNFVADLLARLSSNPTAQDLDYLVEAYTKVGYVAAQAQALAEQAEAERKYQEATKASEVRQMVAASGDRITEKAVENAVYVATYDYKKAEIRAAEKAAKLKNLLAATGEAINAIKFLGRYDSPVSPTIRGPQR